MAGPRRFLVGATRCYVGCQRKRITYYFYEAIKLTSATDKPAAMYDETRTNNDVGLMNTGRVLKMSMP